MRRQLPVMLIVTVLTGLVAIACLVQVFELKGQVQNLQRTLSDQQMQLQESVSSQYRAVKDLLEEEASLLASSHFSYGTVDTQDMTVEFCCTVTPKEFTPGQTTAAVVIGGTQYPMELENGSFTAHISWPVFEELEVTQVLFWTDGVQQAEPLEWYSIPRYDALPAVYADFAGDCSGTTEYHVEGELNVEIDAAMNQTVEFESIELVELLDGEEVARETFAGEENYRDSTSYSACQYLDQTYEIPQGAVFELYVEVVSGDGLHYRVPVVRRVRDEAGQLAEPTMNGEALIYDAEGNLLYNPFYNA